MGPAGPAGPAGLTRYRAELVPWLWMLSLSSDCRTFGSATALDVATHVFRGAGYSAFQTKVTAKLPAYDYLAQYQETNLAFVSRLLEAAGLYYTFEHGPKGHTLVVSDAVGSAVPCGLKTPVDIAPAASAAGAWPDVVTAVTREYAVHTRSVALGDTQLLRRDSAGTSNSAEPTAKGERYTFLGVGPEGLGSYATDARLRIEAEEAGGDVVSDTSTCNAFAVGTRIKLGRSGTPGGGR